MSLEQIKPRLAEIGINQILSENFWNSIRANLNFLNEIKYWIEVCYSKFRYQNQESDLEFLGLAKELLPVDTTKPDSWQEWLDAIKTKTNRKGKELFMPIRQALSGKEHGPELKNLITLIDRNEILARLSK